MIDRITPMRRPPGKPAGFHLWRSLLFMHWPVPVDTLRPLVPTGLELDLHEGVAYVGVVPFVMEGVRPRWWPSRLAFNFLETNVRTYVVRDDEPGVFFFSLEAASRLAVWTARQFWGLPYFHAAMHLERKGDEVHYRSRRTGSPTGHEVRYRIGPALGELPLASLDYFFLERYLLFVARRDRVLVGQVHHTPYPAHRAEILEVEDSLLPATGIEGCSGLPPFAHYSPGVDVEVFGLRE